MRLAANKIIIWGLFICLLLGLLGCGEEVATYIVVNVTAKRGVNKPEKLDVLFTQNGKDRLNSFSLAGRAEPRLPSSFIIRTTDVEALITLTVTARALDGQTVGVGSGRVQTRLSARADLQIELSPTDFQVNSRYTSKQFFSTTAGGRQVATDEKGNFVSVWEDDGGGLQRMDIWYRIFDSTTTPTTNLVNSSTEELQANADGTKKYDMPAVARQADGRFVVAWQRYINFSGTQYNGVEITCRGFLANGLPDPSSNSGGEMVLNASGASEYATPDIAVLRDQNYIVVWEQKDAAGNWNVSGRLLDSNGVPRANSSGKNEPISVSIAPSMETRPLPAVAASSIEDGFIVAWIEEKRPKVRFYGQLGQPLGDALLANQSPASGGESKEVQVAATQEGYAVIWVDKISTSTSGQFSSAIRLRRFDVSGKPLEEEFTLNTTTSGDQDSPIITSMSNGQLLAAWNNSQSEADIDGGVRGRLIHVNGFPVGLDFPINFDTSGKQHAPSLAPQGIESFVAIWIDENENGDVNRPDTQGSSIRGRLLFPDYNIHGGQVGTLCDTTGICDEGLACQTINNEQRCVAVCQSANSHCPHGGQCQTLNGATGMFCLYN